MNSLWPSWSSACRRRETARSEGDIKHGRHGDIRHVPPGKVCSEDRQTGTHSAVCPRKEALSFEEYRFSSTAEPLTPLQPVKKRPSSRWILAGFNQPDEWGPRPSRRGRTKIRTGQTRTRSDEGHTHYAMSMAHTHCMSMAHTHCKPTDAEQRHRGPPTHAGAAPYLEPGRCQGAVNGGD